MADFLELGFVIVSLLAFLVVARSAFGWVARAEGYSLSFETTVKDNPAVGIRFGLFLLASAIPFLNLLQPSGAGLREDLNVVGFYGLVSIVLLIISREVNDKLILFSFSNDAEVVGKKNVAIAVVEGSSYLGTAFIVSGAFSNVESGIGASFIWFGIGLGVMAILDNIYALAVPGMQEALASQDLACALSLGGFLVSGGMALGAAISGESLGWAQDAIDVGYFLGLWFLVIIVVQFVMNRLFLPGTRVRKELITDRNIAAGVIEAVLYITVTLFYIRVKG